MGHVLVVRRNGSAHANAGLVGSAAVDALSMVLWSVALLTRNAIPKDKFKNANKCRIHIQ